ncbi:MAG: hypothetical protein P8Z00_07300 [Anaerolineales bacterium]|jgi:hypothetical protein
MNISHRVFLLLTGLLFATTFAYADTPTSLRGEHGAQVSTSGKIELFRVQTAGLGLGAPNDHINADVFVTLDSAPDMVFGISTKSSDTAASEMIDTLREAYLHGMPVTIQSPVMPNRKHVTITWVQLGK